MVQQKILFQGDSGGPLMLYDESVSSWLLIGIVSFGNREQQQQQQLNEENKNIDCWL